MIRALLKESSIYAIPTMLASMAGFFMLPIYTRVLTPADYGLLETVTKITDVFGLFLGAGIADAVVRFYSGTENNEERKAIVATSVMVVILFGLLGGGVFALLSQPLSYFFLNSSNKSLLIISFSAVAVGLLLRIALSIYRSDSQPWRFALVSMGMLITQIVFNLLALFVFKIGVSGMLLSSLCATFLWSSVTIAPIFFKSRGTFDRGWCRRLLSYGFPLIFASLSQFMLNFSDRFFLVRNISMDSLGIYSIAYRIGMLVTMIFSIFGQSWWPSVVRMSTKPDAIRNIRRSNALMSLISAWACVSVILFAEPLVNVMTTASFRGAHLFVPPIAASYWIFCLVNGPMSVGLKLRNRTKVFAAISAATAALCLVLSFIFIPPYGAWGAVFVTLASFCFQFLIAGYLGYRCWPDLVDFAPAIIGMAAIAPGALLAYSLPFTGALDVALRGMACLILGAALGIYWLCRFRGVQGPGSQQELVFDGAGDDK